MVELSLQESKSVTAGICPSCLIAGTFFITGSSSAALGYLTNQLVLFIFGGTLTGIACYYGMLFYTHYT